MKIKLNFWPKWRSIVLSLLSKQTIQADKERRNYFDYIIRKFIYMRVISQQVSHFSFMSVAVALTILSAQLI